MDGHFVTQFNASLFAVRRRLQLLIIGARNINKRSLLSFEEAEY